MSTRGAIGIRFGETDKIAYNHFDSYPEGLGNSFIEWLNGKSVDELKEVFDNIRLIEEHKSYGWNGDGFNNEFQNASDFMFDSLFCEYAYVVNLDTNKLEFYVGFNNNPNANGRYAKCNNPCKLSDGSNLYGVALKQELPLDEVFAGKWKVDAEGNGFILI